MKNTYQAVMEIRKLSTLKREGWLRRGIPEHLCESVAEHSINTAKAGFSLTRDLRLSMMLLIHDAHEGITGDITPFDEVTDKRRIETRAAMKVLKPLPFGDKMFQLWLEQELRLTDDAKLAFQLDKLDAGIRAMEYDALGFHRAKEFYQPVRKDVTDPLLSGIFEEMYEARYAINNWHERYFEMLEAAKL